MSKALDLDGDGIADLTKYIVLYSNSRTPYAYYKLSKSGTLYVAMGLLVDIYTNLFYKDGLTQVNTPTGTNTFGYKNTKSRTYVYVKAYQPAQYIGT